MARSGGERKKPPSYVKDDSTAHLSRRTGDCTESCGGAILAVPYAQSFFREDSVICKAPDVLDRITRSTLRVPEPPMSVQDTLSLGNYVLPDMTRYHVSRSRNTGPKVLALASQGLNAPFLHYCSVEFRTEEHHWPRKWLAIIGVGKDHHSNFRFALIPRHWAPFAHSDGRSRQTRRAGSSHEALSRRKLRGRA